MKLSVICPKGKGYTKEEEYLKGVHIFRHNLPEEGNGAIGYLREYTSALREEIRLAKKIYKGIASLMQVSINEESMQLGAKERALSLALIDGIQKIRLSGAENRAFVKWSDLFSNLVVYCWE